ncbi:M55 family metallopeptidase [Isachenkonia alkalipeptolytica]|uniref:Peptidase M55 n=1 Tax=Isachenkonia alkalipeptolytica TaxID=2565777 RepID=A0AA43XHU9_9CLOT|nr:M55 family metallopeptidase [Isachenkonia alkalipeptolytica]NBG87128.1 peptidase M55 [Isachenkonia alkalipeptolytica]
MKIYISADIEGIWGVVSKKQLGGESSDYQRTRKLMTEEVNLLCTYLWENGAREILVNDSHGPMDNILIEDLDPKVGLISGYPKAHSMMEGLDDSFDGAILIGYHPKAGTKKGIFDHTYSGRVVATIKIDHQEMGEVGLNARLAGHYGVPVILVSGDERVCQDVKEEIGEIETVAVKTALSRYCAKNLPYETVKENYKISVKKAMASIGFIKPLPVATGPVIEIEFQQSVMAELVENIPGIIKIDERTVNYQARDVSDMYRVMRCAITLASTVL